MKNRKGFTLIEMLAVVTIIGLLAGLIITRINRSIADSKKTASLANANLLVGAFEDYYMQAKARGAFNGCSYDFGGNSNTCTGFSFTGAQPDEGLITLSSTGSVDGDLVFGDYSYVVDGGIVTTYVELADPVFDFDYVSVGNDKEQYFAVPATGYYKLEVWGAQGGSYNATYRGGYGGYSSGVVRLTSGGFIFINVGGNGVSGITGSLAGGYNGGGNGYGGPCSSDRYGASGGGATHIAFSNGTLASFDGNNDGVGSSTEIRNIIIVAGGGGGSHYMYGAYGSGASGGGYVGNTAAWTNVNHNYYVQPTGGTQNSGGSIGYSYSTRTITYAKFGQGQNFQGGNCSEGSGGGGGFYGGGAGSFTPGAGGSGYIGNPKLSNGVMYCYGCAEISTPGIKTIDSNGTNKDANCPNGYSTDAVSNCAKSGDGHARVTYLGRTLD